MNKLMNKQILQDLDEDQLRKILKDKNIYFDENYTKDHLIDLILMNSKRNFSIENSKNKNELSNKMVKIGAVLNIVLASISILLLSITIIIFLYPILFLFRFWTLFMLIPLIIGAIFCIKTNVKFLKGKETKTNAAVLGILFSWIIGGVFILVFEK